jgi:hypothetical protein
MAPIEELAGPDISLAAGGDATLADARIAVSLERGVMLTRVGVDEWQYWSGGSPSAGTLTATLALLGLRVIRTRLRINPSYIGEFVVPLTPGAPMLEYQVQQLGQYQVMTVDPRFATQVLHVAYINEATVHHCSRLVSEYVDVLKRVTRNGKDLTLVSKDFIYSGAVSPYFEFDALITAAVRAYDTLRFPLWTAFGPRGSVPSNFQHVAENIVVPGNLAVLINQAVDAYQQIKRYRDCIQHYAHFGARLPFARVQLHRDAAWSVLALLPDNPEAKSYNRFSFQQRIDALTYGWTVADLTVRHATDIISALPRRADDADAVGTAV